MKFIIASIFVSINVIAAQYGMVGSDCCGSNYNSMYGNSLSGFGGLSGFGSALPVNSISTYGSSPFSLSNSLGYQGGVMGSSLPYTLPSSQYGGLSNIPYNSLSSSQLGSLLNTQYSGLSNSQFGGLGSLSNYPISDPILAGAMSSYQNFNGLNSPLNRFGSNSIYSPFSSKKASPQQNQDILPMMTDNA
uniref:Secreted protein n=1 Tax=Parastrongyloides trichosuri TaxID=131310 RepID=A0A0N4ZJX8_PARTI